MDASLFELRQRLKTEEAVEFRGERFKLKLKLKEGFNFGGGDPSGSVANTPQANQQLALIAGIWLWPSAKRALKKKKEKKGNVKMS